MNLIKRLFKKNKELKDAFTIEYYPITNNYLPKYGEYYLRINPRTGIVEKKKYLCYSNCFNTEILARHLLNTFKEQELKESLIIIKVE